MVFLIVGRRHALINQRGQEEGETVDVFITSLYAVAEHCNFGDLHDELIRDRIVMAQVKMGALSHNAFQ